MSGETVVNLTGEPAGPDHLRTMPVAPDDGWDEPEGRGVARWKALFSGDLTPTAGLTSGIVFLEPGGFLAPHRHPPAEIYHVLDGELTVTIDGSEYRAGAGDTLHIPGMAEHGCRNLTALPLRFLYVFPTDSFADVTYIFSARGDPAAVA